MVVIKVKDTIIGSGHKETMEAESSHPRSGVSKEKRLASIMFK